MSAGVSSATPSASGAMRLTMPVSTLPAPSSTKLLDARASATPARFRASAPRPVTCSTSRRRIASGSLRRPRGDIGDQRHARGARRSRLRQRLGHLVGGRLHQRAMERRARPAAAWRAAPSSLARSRSRARPPPWSPEITTCPAHCRWRRRRRRPRRPAGRPLRRRWRTSAHSAPISAAMAPSPTGTARCIAWPRSFSSRAASANGRARPPAQSAEYSPERMAGDDSAPSRSGRRRPRAPARAPPPATDRHQRRLGVLGQGQVLVRPFAHQLGQLLAQRVVDFLEHLARGGEGVGQIARPCRRPGCPVRER